MGKRLFFNYHKTLIALVVICFLTHDIWSQNTQVTITVNQLPEINLKESVDISACEGSVLTYSDLKILAITNITVNGIADNGATVIIGKTNTDGTISDLINDSDNRLTLDSYSSGSSNTITLYAQATSSAGVGGCVGEVTPFTIQILEKPKATITANNTLCTAHTTTFTVQKESDIDPIYGAWSVSPQTLAENIIPSENNSKAEITWATTAGTGTVLITLTSSNSCTNTANLNITVNATPVVVISTPAKNALCAGEIQEYHSTGSSGIAAYLWSITPGDSLFAQTGQTTDTYTAAWKNGGTTSLSAGVILTGTSAEGCAATDSVTVSVYPLPRVSLTADATICNKSLINLTATLDIGQLENDENWKVNWDSTIGTSGKDIESTTGSRTITLPVTPDTSEDSVIYRLTEVTDGKGCQVTYTY